MATSTRRPRPFAGKSARGSSRVVHVGLTQMACGDDPKANLDASSSHWLERAAKQGAQIICTQELFRSQYFCQSRGPPLLRPGRDRSPARPPTPLQSSPKAHRSVIIASLFEKRAPGLYHNTAVVIDADGSLLGIYRKMHIPDDPLYYEKFYFTPGDIGFRAWQTRYAQDRRADLLGPVVSRGRAPHRAAGRRDPLLPHGHRLASGARSSSTARRSTSLGTDPALPRRRQRLLRVRAANRIGQEQIAGADGKPVSPGRHRVLGPVVRRRARRPDRRRAHRPTREEVLLVDCDLAQVEFSRTHWPFLRDRRIDAYGDLTQALHRLPDWSAGDAVTDRDHRRRHGHASSTRTPRPPSATRFPPEWAPHAATWLSWPRPEGISFPGRYHARSPT